jgi:histidinol phosphatase-like PHP family hydrolase
VETRREELADLEEKELRGPMRVPQDLHIHTNYSTGDSSVLPEMTLGLISQFRHAEILGISDHIEYVLDDVFPRYEREVRSCGLYLGGEVNGGEWTSAAAELPLDYYIYHCRDIEKDYRGLEELLAAGRPVIVAHPRVMGTDLEKLPEDCYIEINNRYIWRGDWRHWLSEYRNRFRFVISSDAHQPHWLNQNIARGVAMAMDIEETLLFPLRVPAKN